MQAGAGDFVSTFRAVLADFTTRVEEFPLVLSAQLGMPGKSQGQAEFQDSHLLKCQALALDVGTECQTTEV